MPDPNNVRINNVLYSWTSCTFELAGAPFKGIVEVNFEQKRERKVVYAAQRDGTPLGKTAGKYSVEGFTIKLLKDSADDFTTVLSALGIGSYGDAEFTISGQVTEPVTGAIPLTFLASGCTVDGEKDAHAEGIDELTTEFTIGCLSMTKNGKRLWSVKRSLGL